MAFGSVNVPGVSRTELNAALSSQIANYKVIETTLLAANWTGEAAPYYYDLVLDGITADSIQEFLEPVAPEPEDFESTEEYDAAYEQWQTYVDALQAADMHDAGQEEGISTIVAVGTKPTIDLPVRVIVTESASGSGGDNNVDESDGNNQGTFSPYHFIGGVPYGKELTDDWATLQARTKEGDFEGIQIGDFKTITLTTGEVVIMEVAGIDNYYNYGDTEYIVGHHIDFISRDCLAGARKMNTTDKNNGTSAQPNPWRASNLYSVLNTTVYNTLPPEVQAVIIDKRLLMESRYSASGVLSANNSAAWNYMGKLWLPMEVEVFGVPCWSEVGYGTYGHYQYPIFYGGVKHIIKGDGNGGERCDWWEASARRDNSTYFCSVHYNGVASVTSASNTRFRVPLCFRIG